MKGNKGPTGSGRNGSGGVESVMRQSQRGRITVRCASDACCSWIIIVLVGPESRDVLSASNQRYEVHADIQGSMAASVTLLDASPCQLLGQSVWSSLTRR